MTSHRLVPVAFLLILGLLAGCKDAAAPANDPVSPANTTVADNHGSSAQDWSAPVQLGSPINLPDADTRNAFETRDGLSLYFASIREGGLGGRDIYVAHRRSGHGPWGDVTNLGSKINVDVDNVHGDNHPNVSPGGHWLFFSSARDGGSGGLDLYSSYRANVHDDQAWQQAVNLGPAINSDGDERSPSFVFDLRSGTAQLYYAADHFGPTEDDIYVSTRRRDGTWGPGVLVPSLSSPYDENKVCLSHDGLTAVFVSTRPLTAGGEENDGNVWIATRRSTRDPFGPATMIVADYGLPTITWDDQTIYVTGPQTTSPDEAGIFTVTRLHGHGFDHEMVADADIGPDEE